MTDKAATKTATIAALLDSGAPPKQIAQQVGCDTAYVRAVRKRLVAGRGDPYGYDRRLMAAIRSDAEAYAAYLEANRERMRQFRALGHARGASDEHAIARRVLRAKGLWAPATKTQRTD